MKCDFRDFAYILLHSHILTDIQYILIYTYLLNDILTPSILKQENIGLREGFLLNQVKGTVKGLES